jgi:hypothetical protein
MPARRPARADVMTWPSSLGGPSQRDPSQRDRPRRDDSGSDRDRRHELSLTVVDQMGGSTPQIACQTEERTLTKASRIVFARGG